MPIDIFPVPAENHATRHATGGADEVAHKVHASRHNIGGADLGGALQQAYHSGYYYGPVGGSISNTALTQSTEYALPFWAPTAASIDRIAIEVQAGAASSTLRLGLRADNSGIPGTLVTDFGTVDTTSTGVKSITINQALSAGLNWLTGTAQGGAPNIYICSGVFPPIGNPAATVNINSAAYTQTGVTGALGSSYTVASISHGPRIIVRYV